MNDYISRQAAIIQLSHNKSRGDDEWMLAVESDMGVIRAIPAVDVVPVVRCQDCKYWRSYWGRCYKHDEYGMAPDDFCSYGERKVVGHD